MNMDKEIKLWHYRLLTERDTWLANVVLTSLGMVAIASDWGNAVHTFTASGERDFRDFILNIYPDYLGQKFATQTQYLNGRSTREIDKRCINLAEKVLPVLKVAIHAEMEKE